MKEPSWKAWILEWFAAWLIVLVANMIMALVMATLCIHPTAFNKQRETHDS